MARYPIGQPVRVSVQVRDAGGGLVDPTTVTLTVRTPAGSNLTYDEPDTDGTGLYRQDVPTSATATAGRYQYRWLTTGDGAGVDAGSFDIYDPLAGSTLSLEDAKQHVNVPAATTTQDDEVAFWCAVVDAAIERHIGGPILTRAVTERVEPTGGGTTLLLRQLPVVNVTSVGGTAVSGLDVDAESGIVHGSFGSSAVSVVYAAGRGTAVPPAIAGAARIILGHLWQTQRGGVSRPSVSGGETTVMPGLGYAVPNRALELLAPYAVEAWV